jgi:hypothetical protein
MAALVHFTVPHAFSALPVTHVGRRAMGMRTPVTGFPVHTTVASCAAHMVTGSSPTRVPAMPFPLTHSRLHGLPCLLGLFPREDLSHPYIPFDMGQPQRTSRISGLINQLANLAHVGPIRPDEPVDVDLLHSDGCFGIDDLFLGFRHQILKLTALLIRQTHLIGNPGVPDQRLTHRTRPSSAG